MALKRRLKTLVAYLLVAVGAAVAPTRQAATLFGTSPTNLQTSRASVTLVEEPTAPPKKTLEQALKEADDRLKDAPLSYADLAYQNEDKTPPPVEIPLALSVAPAALGIFSVTLFLLNQAGSFGDGEQLLEWVDEVSKMS